MGEIKAELVDSEELVDEIICQDGVLSLVRRPKRIDPNEIRFYTTTVRKDSIQQSLDWIKHEVDE